MGLKLQYDDSQIMDSILAAAAKENIIILPVHDGLICEYHNRDYVAELMLRELLTHTAIEYNSNYLDRLIKIEEPDISCPTAAAS